MRSGGWDAHHLEAPLSFLYFNHIYDSSNLSFKAIVPYGTASSRTLYLPRLCSVVLVIATNIFLNAKQSLLMESY